MKKQIELDFNVEYAKITLKLAGFDVKNKTDDEIFSMVLERLHCYGCSEIKEFKIKDFENEIVDKIEKKLKKVFSDMQFHTGRAWFDFDAAIDRCKELVTKITDEIKNTKNNW